MFIAEQICLATVYKRPLVTNICSLGTNCKLSKNRNTFLAQNIPLCKGKNKDYMPNKGNNKAN